MRTGPSLYAGIAAAFVFGVGLLLSGKTLIGIGVLGMGVYCLGLILASEWSTKALLTAAAALIWSGLLGYQALANEMTGKAIYWHAVGRRTRSEPVTREQSPAKFREATNIKWGLSAICLGVSVCAFMSYRKAG